jgi:hypothetical protein
MTEQEASETLLPITQEKVLICVYFPQVSIYGGIQEAVEER